MLIKETSLRCQSVLLVNFLIYRVPNISDVDWATGKGDIYPYFSFGAACSEVEIDCLTGAHSVSNFLMSILK